MMTPQDIARAKPLSWAIKGDADPRFEPGPQNK
jgi:hypothetical protein